MPEEAAACWNEAAVNEVSLFPTINLVSTRTIYRDSKLLWQYLHSVVASTTESLQDALNYLGDTKHNPFHQFKQHC